MAVVSDGWGPNEKVFTVVRRFLMESLNSMDTIPRLSGLPPPMSALVWLGMRRRGNGTSWHGIRRQGITVEGMLSTARWVHENHMAYVSNCMVYDEERSRVGQIVRQSLPMALSRPESAMPHFVSSSGKQSSRRNVIQHSEPGKLWLSNPPDQSHCSPHGLRCIHLI